jgi:hypothetical protein
MIKRISIALLVCAVVTVAAVYFVTRNSRLVQSTISNATFASSPDPNAWSKAVERVREVRDPSANATGIHIPPELKHYSERYWFLATQVAEIEKYNVYTSQDFLDLAALIQRGELVSVPGVTDTYILMGIGQRANDEEFTKFQEKPGEPPAPVDPRDYESLQTLARNFAGRSFDLNIPADRYELRMSMLCSLRPEALKILEEVAAAYHRQFGRPLPVSSLVRPEQYQHSLNRVNRNAVLIESPPHSTGLAFDIDYRYMSTSEQTFVMAELARIKQEGRIEVIRERNANYHVFAFLHGMRPSDDLITASLEKAGRPAQEAHHVEKKPVKAKTKAKSRSSRRRRR